MQVYIGTMHRIIIEKKCGCRVSQEFKDAIMKQPDGEATYKPCTKHKKGVVGEVIKELMLEVLENKAEEHHSKTVIAIAEANATSRTGESETPAEAPKPVGEGAASETRVPIKVGGKVVQVGAKPESQRPGLRRAATATAKTTPAAVSARKAAAAAGTSNAIDAELAGATGPTAGEDTRITHHLVDAPGGLLGPEELDPSEV